MKSQSFVHLHLHTCFSLLDGACRIDRLMDAVRAGGQPAVAVTDHGVMYGAVDFYKAARERGIKPIIGCELYISTGRHRDRDKSPTHHLVLLAEDLRGYHNLARLVSTAHLDGFYYKPRIDHELLARHHEGLIGLSSCLKGEVSSHLAQDDLPGATAAAERYADILGRDRFYLEVQDHGIPEQRKVNRLSRTLSQRTGLPCVATNDVHYLEREHAAAHEVLLCLQTQTVMSDPKRMRYPTDQFYLKTREEMDALFHDMPEAVRRTLEIAERCNVEFDFDTLHFPTFEVPQGMTQRAFLRQQALEGVRRLYGLDDPEHPRDGREREVMQVFEHEFGVIERTGFVNYFLVVWDFVRFAREQGIWVGPGRGSGGGSVIAYALGITAIDPLRYKLIFERFLNPERVSPPDFDIDFCQSRRDEVIQYVKDRYGRDHVAQIITFGSLGAKTVIRDVGRVLEIPYAQCDRLSKMVPDDLKITLEQALEQNPEFKKAYQGEEDCRRILDYAFVLEGLYRNPGTHAAGVVIGERPLIDIVPLARDKNKSPITQYTKQPIEDIGLLKMDFLGLKTLTVLREAVELVARHRGIEVDVDHLPFDDRPTYDLLSRGDTVGVFQLESAGMRDLIRRIGIDAIEDLIAMIALYRPGPMNMLPDYVERKSGKAKIRYDHPLLEPVLKETYGVMVYQEQVMQAANVLAGFTLGEADVLRRAMGKKNPAVMQKQRAKFIEGCKALNGIRPPTAKRIFDNIEKFAGYGFNKAHSAGYAIISYQTAYLKANYPAEFMAALLSSEIGNFDKLPVFINESEAAGLEVLPPDVNVSGVRFEPEGERGIRYGLAGIKNVGSGAAESIVSARRDGPFKSLIDFCSRVDTQIANRKAIESLVQCGAMDGLGMHRARLFNGVEFAMNRAAGALADRRIGQASLFDLMEGNAAEDEAEDLPDCPPWPESRLLGGERELLGVYMSGHPLTAYRSLLASYQTVDPDALPDVADRTPLRVGGIAAAVTRRVSKTTKEPWAVVRFETLETSLEVLVFPEAYRKYGVHLQPESPLLVCGELSRREDQPKLMAQEVYPLADAPRHFATRVGIHLPAGQLDDDRLARLKETLRLHPGTTPVVLCLLFPSGEKVFVQTEGAYRVLAEPSLIRELEQELGEGSVFVKVSRQACRQSAPRRGRRRRPAESA